MSYEKHKKSDTNPTSNQKYMSTNAYAKEISKKNTK